MRAYIDLDDQLPEHVLQDVQEKDFEALVKIIKILLEPFEKDPLLYALIVRSLFGEPGK